MNKLPPAGEDRWRLPRHAHLVVYEAGRFRDGDRDDGNGGNGAGGNGGGGTGGSDGAGRSGDDGAGGTGGDGGSESGGDGRTGGTGGPGDGDWSAEAGELVTVYDCGAAQKPPSAQFIGHLVRVRADADVARTETGYVVRMRAPSILEKQGERRWVVAER